MATDLPLFEWQAPHQHYWLRTFSLQDPPVDVFDCSCGKRRRVHRGSGLKPEEVVDSVNPGGSVMNALNVLSDLQSGHSALYLIETKG